MTLNNPPFGSAVTPGVTCTLEADTTHSTPAETMRQHICCRITQHYEVSDVQDRYTIRPSAVCLVQAQNNISNVFFDADGVRYL